MSCNGCRVLRKGCSDGCVLRQCLRWIDSPDAQGHATVFVAKFFGRAGMMALITSIPEHQRPALFQSLLYEACGRTINPVFGAVGLLCSGNWKLCQDAVDTVMKGGLLCPASTGTGRPGTAAAAPPPFSPGRSPRVRLGRGYASNATAVAPQSAANFPTGQELSLDSSKLAGTTGWLKKREMDHDGGGGGAFPAKQQRMDTGGFKVEASDEAYEDPDDELFGEEAASRSGRGIACLSRKPRDSDAGAAAAAAPPRDDDGEVGLDLTLGSCCSSGWKMDKRGHRSGSSWKRTSPGSPCHSSEADSDTTDLSISMPSQIDSVAVKALLLPSPPTPPPAREVLRGYNDLLLMDLLH